MSGLTVDRYPVDWSDEKDNTAISSA